MMETRKLALTLLVLMVFGFAAWAVETAVDRYRPRMSIFGRFWIVLALGLAIGFAALKVANAHDHGRPELDAWFKGLSSRAKAACCDGSDATRLDDIDWESRAGRYRVRIQGEWIDVPEDAVVDGPNRAGPAMVWPVRGYLGLTIRCFMPGMMS
jgi:hypothetical protein